MSALPKSGFPKSGSDPIFRRTAKSGSDPVFPKNEPDSLRKTDSAVKLGSEAFSSELVFAQSLPRNEPGFVPRKTGSDPNFDPNFAPERDGLDGATPRRRLQAVRCAHAPSRTVRARNGAHGAYRDGFIGRPTAGAR